MRVTLDNLPPGQAGYVARVLHADALTMRLLDMGFTEGARVEALGDAREDPLRVRLRGYVLSLRREEARRVLLRREGGAR